MFDRGVPDDLYLWLICADQRATEFLAANTGTRCWGFLRGRREWGIQRHGHLLMIIPGLKVAIFKIQYELVSSLNPPLRSEILSMLNFCYIRKCHFSPVTQSQFQTGARSEKNLPYISTNLSDADISDRQILEWSIARVTENWVTCMYLTDESAVVFGH